MFYVCSITDDCYFICSIQVEMILQALEYEKGKFPSWQELILFSIMLIGNTVKAHNDQSLLRCTHMFQCVNFCTAKLCKSSYIYLE